MRPQRIKLQWEIPANGLYGNGTAPYAIGSARRCEPHGLSIRIPRASPKLYIRDPDRYGFSRGISGISEDSRIRCVKLAVPSRSLCPIAER